MNAPGTDLDEMDLHLNPEERRLLIELIARTVGDLRVEVRHTDTPDFHDHLLHEEEIMKGLMLRLCQT